MMLLSDGIGEPIIIALDDDTEIEIEVIETEGKAKVLVRGDVEVVQPG